MISQKQLEQVGTPCIVVKPYQMKLGHVFPGDIPLLIDATNETLLQKKQILARAHEFIPLAVITHWIGRSRQFIAWPDNTVQELFIEVDK